MWRVRAMKPLPGIRSFDIEEAWGESGLACSAIFACALAARSTTERRSCQ